MSDGKFFGRSGISALVALTSTALFAMPILSGADGRERTVALVVSVDTAVVLRQGDRFPLPLMAGEVLFPHDRLTIVRGNVELVRCSFDGAGQRLTVSSGTIVFGTPTDDQTQATVAVGAGVDDC